MLEKKLIQILKKREQENALRSLTLTTNRVDFFSNDYLGFSKKKWVSTLSNGSTGSRLLSGNSQIHIDCENFLSNFYQTESALLFQSGYDANLGFFSCVPQKNDTIIYDELCHASIRDGMRLGKARNFSFRHNDLDHLNEKINQATGNCFVVVESVYSMDGDFSPLNEISKLCQQKGANLVIDEAHASGIFGPMGQGIGYDIPSFARIHTFGKAFGCHGAVIVGSSVLIDFLINFSRPLIYTTALSPHSVSCILQAHQEISNCSEINQLHQNINLFKKHIRNPKLIDSDSAIQCIIISGNNDCKKTAQKIQSEGLDVRPILHPTVKQGQERLRICLHSYNTKEEILHLCQQLNQ
ncbi:MAG: aminotransferase class I/II-fold pyridoxal phosphate-dependent enzyme [Flavobacteriales bacterium]